MGQAQCCTIAAVTLDRPRVMGILNVTPDSFSDGGKFFSPPRALDRAAAMIGEGADIIDIGGESTRPGAREVSESEELERVVPVIEAIRGRFDVAISVDTSKPTVMRAAVAAGANLINDVRALRAPGALQAANELGVPVCLMHMQGEPRTMQRHPHYEDVVAEVIAFLRERVDACLQAGIPVEHIVLDPGFGFGKTLEHNLQLLAALDQLVELGFPVLAGLSRKSMLGALLGLEVEQRLPGSLVLATIALMKGARIIRVHDVRESRQAADICDALQRVTHKE